ncbi:VirD4-like conjugal transfer protein, CD1115 family [Ruminococcus sp.]|uniref:VirD4-like conjugal transfer protein, CD1115 family n=1 Tax=Ruminococcus sp. TaxID=41978 RepID=UPI003A97C9D0
MNMKKLFLLNLPYLLFVYPFDKLAQAFRLAPGADLSGKLLSIGDGFTAAFSSPWLSFHPTDLLIGIAGAVILRMAVYLKGKNAKKYRHGIEYGSARWGTAADIAPYMDKDFFKNIPMTQTERITMASRPKQPKYARNKNILVIGGSGSGKTRFFCKPSLLQAHSSYVCTDPKGTLLPEIGTFLERKKYRIKCLNLINFRKSMKYNPLAYIRSEKDILKLVNALIMNTKGEGEKSSEDFWVKAERLYYSALIGYIWYEATEEEKNFITLLDLINASEAREDDETYQSPVDLLFSQLEEREPDHFAVKQYRKFKMAAGKTLKSILISCGARLAPFDIKELRDLMEYDELELDTLGDQKTALFVILSDTDSTFNFVAALMYSQLFNLLCDKADDFYGGRLPVHVRLILDEFANIGQIPNFDKLIATIRSREISASIILQSQSQLKTIYKDAADTIVGNCDVTLFLGGKEKSTLKEISELLGKETIDSLSQSENRGAQTSHGLSYQKLGKELMTQDEIAVMDGGKCILQLRGVRPFFSDKYDLTKHPRYKYLSDADKKNVFDVERYMKRRPAIVKPDEPFDMYELNASDLEPDNNNSTKRKEK